MFVPMIVQYDGERSTKIVGIFDDFHIALHALITDLENEHLDFSRTDILEKIDDFVVKEDEEESYWDLGTNELTNRILSTINNVEDLKRLCKIFGDGGYVEDDESIDWSHPCPVPWYWKITEHDIVYGCD